MNTELLHTERVSIKSLQNDLPTWSPCRHPRTAWTACWISSSLLTTATPWESEIDTQCQSTLTIVKCREMLLQIRPSRLGSRTNCNGFVLVIVPRRTRLIQMDAFFLRNSISVAGTCIGSLTSAPATSKPTPYGRRTYDWVHSCFSKSFLVK